MQFDVFVVSILSILHYYMISVSSTGPCSQYTHENATSLTRSVKNVLSPGANGLCDHFDGSTWYRFTTSTGQNQMIPTQCPAKNSCGTQYPIWLDGTHPQITNQISSVKVCVQVEGICCFRSWTIEVVKCVQKNEDFFVYKLSAPAIACPTSYCLENEPQVVSTTKMLSTIKATTAVITTKGSGNQATSTPMRMINYTTGAMSKTFNIEISDGILNQKIINGSSYITKTGEFTVKISDEKGTIPLPTANVESLPSSCNRLSGEPAPNLFCVNTASGDIYVTTVADFEYLGGQNFTLSIAVKIVNSPAETTTLNVHFTDECRATSKPYQDLLDNECQLFSNTITRGFGLTAGSKSTGFRYTRRSFERLLIDMTILRSTFGNRVGDATLLITEILNEGTREVSLDPIPFVVPEGTSDVTVPLSFKDNAELSRSFRFTISFGGSALLLNTNSIKLREIISWNQCRRPECVSAYKEWKKHVATSEPKCKKDTGNVERYFERCINLDPVFTTTPLIDETTTIDNCIYRSMFAFDQKYTYLLINGVRRDFELNLPQRKKRSLDENHFTARLPRYQIRSYNDVGDVQCAIFDPERMKAPALSNVTRFSFALPGFGGTPTYNADIALLGNSLTIIGPTLITQFTLTNGEAFWMKDGTIISNETAFAGGNQFPALQLKELTMLSTGFYQCGVKIAVSDEIIKSEGVNITVNAVDIEFTSQPNFTISNRRIFLQGCKYKFNTARLARSNSNSFANAAYYEILNSTGIFKLTSISQPTPTPSIPPRTTTIGREQFLRKRRAADTEELSATIPGIDLTDTFQLNATYRCGVFDPRYMHIPSSSSWVAGESLSLNITFSGIGVASGDLAILCRYESPLTIDERYAFLAADSVTNVGVFESRAGNVLRFTVIKYVLNGTIHCGYHDKRYMKNEMLSGTGLSIPEPKTILRSPNQTVEVGSTKSYLCLCRLKGWGYVDPKYADIYLLKDDSIKITINRTLSEKIVQKNEEIAELCSDSDEFVYMFPAVKLSDEGFYQCAYHPNGLPEPVLSEKMKFTVSALEVIFTSKPSQTNEDILKGCSYNSKQDMADFSYLLLNDTIRINYTMKADAGRTPDFILSSYRFRGRFQCVIFDENRMRKPVYSNYSDFISLSEPTFLRASPDIIPVRLTGGVQSTFTFPGGCQMTVPKQLKFKPSEVYWLKNGVKKTFFNLTQLNPVPSKNGFDVIYTFDNKARVVTREAAGVYQCVADFDGLDTPVIKRTFNVTVKVIEAKFVSNPSWQINKDNIQIQGCKYKAENPLYEHAYYLLNGEQKIRIEDINSETPSMFRKDEDGFYHLPPLTINSFDRLGTYECVIAHVLLEGQTISTASADLTTLKESDILPTFKSHPTSAHSNTTGGVVQISGCIYHTKIPLSRSEEVFYLFNSVKKLGVPFPVLGAGDRGGGIDRSTTGVDEDSGFDPDRPLPREEREGGDFFRPSPDMRMIDYRKSTSSYEDQGFYQCGVTIGSGPYQKTIVSNSVDVQFVDVASAKMNVRLDQQWDKDLANSSSETFKKLEKQLVEDIEKILPEENGVKPLVRILGFKSGSVIADMQVLYPNVTQTSRRQKCKELQQSLKDGVKNSQTFKVTSVDVNSLDCCSEDLEGEESFKGVERFPETLVSQSVTNNCTYKQSASSQRQCLGNMKDGPKWSNVNLQNCPAKSPITNSLIELSLKKICTPSTLTDCQTPVEVSGNLSQLINRTDSITTRQDLEYISIVLQNLAIHPTAFLPNDTDNAKTIVANVLETVGNVIGSNRTIVAQAQKAKQTSSNILKSLDVIAENLGQIAAFFNINETIQIKFENPYVALAVTYTEPKPLKIFGGFDSDRSISVNIAAREDKPTYHNNKTLEILASSRIPKETFRNKSQIVYSFLFQDDTLFLTGKQIKALDAGQPIVSPLSSQILAVTIGKDKLENLSIPILLKFEKIHQPVIGTEENSFFNNTCTFWEVQQVGLWSSRGCWKINETETQISCECNHLTNFAILLDVTGKQNNPLELRIMTWIGCGISLAGLFLTLLSYTIFKKLHKKLPPKILISLALSLFILLIVFLVGAERGSVVTSKLGCQIVAGILHYFMLTTFLWMLIEAINLYRNFVKIFRSGGDGKFFKNSSRIAWGIPLLIVVINGAVEPDNLGNDQFCVILGNSFYFALLLPVALILFINFIVLIMVLRSLSKNQGSKITSTQKQSLATQTRITLACATLLGLTWLFALLAIGDLSYTFQLLFTIFNSLQGFFIFVFYTLLNTDVQKEWKRVFKIKDKEQGNSSQPVVSTLNREKYHVKSSPTVGIYGNSDTPPAEEIDLSSSTGHLIKQRQHYTNPTYDQTDNSSFKK